MILKRHRPLYREIIKEAFDLTRRERHLWILALFAGMLQTGGIYDVIFKSVAMITNQARDLVRYGNPLSGLTFVNLKLPVFQSVIAYAGMFETAVFSLILILTLLALSIIAQGALLSGLSERMRGRSQSLRECLTFGCRKFWPVAALNIINLGIIFLARFLVMVPYAYSLTSPSLVAVIIYFLAFLVFLAVSVSVTAMHLMALNAVVLEDLSVAHAIKQAYRLLKNSWVLVLELGAVLFLLGFAILLGLTLLTAAAGIPIFLFMLSAATLHWNVLIDIVYALGLILFTALTFTVGAAAISFQYAIWQRLYLRLDKGQASAKLFRWLEGLFQHKT